MGNKICFTRNRIYQFFIFLILIWYISIEYSIFNLNSQKYDLSWRLRIETTIFEIFGTVE